MVECGAEVMLGDSGGFMSKGRKCIIEGCCPESATEKERTLPSQNPREPSSKLPEALPQPDRWAEKANCKITRIQTEPFQSSLRADGLEVIPALQMCCLRMGTYRSRPGRRI